jgi:hypothetical protein
MDDKKQTIKKIFKLSVLSTAIMATAFAPTVQALSTRISDVNRSTRSEVLQHNPITSISTEWQKTSSMDMLMGRPLNADEILLAYKELWSKSLFEIYEDYDGIRLNLPASNVAIRKVWRRYKEPIVHAIYSPQNGVCNIMLMKAQRHSDGSATFTIKNISPTYFDSVDNNGSLSKREHEIMMEVYGQNPAEANRPSMLNGSSQHLFADITPVACVTLAGRVMSRENANLGHYVQLNPRTNYYTTKSGGPFKKKITHHFEAFHLPDQAVLVPRGEFQNAINPFFVLNNHKGDVIVDSGVSMLNVSDYLGNLSQEEKEIHKETMSESAYTGLTIVLAIAMTAALTVATGGALGLALNITPMQAALVAGAVAGTISLINGTINEDVTTTWTNFTSIDSGRSGKSSNDFGRKWEQEDHDIIRQGPMGSKLGSVGSQNRDMRSQWHHLIDPDYTYEVDSLGNFVNKGVNFKSVQRPNESEMFNNPDDNPNYSRFSSCNMHGGSFAGVLAMIVCIRRERESAGDGKQ